MAPVLLGPGPKAPPPLPEHVLEEIFLRIASPADLARASAACASFRRLTADPAFLRRHRSLHPPLLLGFLDPRPVGFLPAGEPHPNAPVARSLDGAADFSFDHIPRRGRRGWAPCDARDGRILLLRPERGVVFPELAVCDPLSRDYALLPPIPDSLVASVLVQVKDEHIDSFEPFLLPSGDYEETQFSVIGWTHCEAKAVVFAYSSVSGSWTVGASAYWDALGLNVQPEGLPPDWWPSYAYGCFYWKVASADKLLKLDINRMEFSVVDLPPNHQNHDVAVVEAGEGRLGMFSHIVDFANPKPLCYFIRQNESQNANEDQMEATIPLPQDYCFHITGASEGYIFLIGTQLVNDRSRAFFSVDIKTFKVERVCSTSFGCSHIHPYFGFPPFMSPRRI
ncbi:hypothetical protein ACP70R_019913 [Stipagrostis hirtigluma subsp. patula]